MFEEQMSEGTTKSVGPLVLKDWIGIVFSTLAFVVSSASFYYSNIRVDEGAVANVIGLNGIDKETAGRLLIRIAVANRGNRPAIVLGADYWFAVAESFDDGAFGFEVVDVDRTLPLYVPAREVRLVTVGVDAAHITSHYDEASDHPDVPRYTDGSPVLYKSGEGQAAARRLFLAMDLQSLDADGDRHEVRSGFFGFVDITESELVGFGALGTKGVGTIELLN